VAHDNVETVRRFFEALANAPDSAGERRKTWERLTADDVVYVEEPMWPGADRYEGRDAVWACWEDYIDSVGVATEISMRDIQPVRDRVVAVVRVAGRTRDSDVPYDHTWGYVCDAADGRLTYFSAHIDPQEAFRIAESAE
jgi:ketosteroid isomerase-like protein